MQNPHAQEAVSNSSPHGDKPFPQDGQFIDMNFMAASNTCSNKSSAGVSRRPLQRRLDSQEFGFASNLTDSSAVAPADELFFKGQLLPLQMDHRRHLVQALSSTSERISPAILARVGSSRLVDDLCQDDEVIEFNSCRLERENPLEYLKESMHGHRLLNHAIIPHPAHTMQISKESSLFITRDEKPKLPFPSNIKVCAEGYCRACVLADRNGEHGILSLDEDEELHSCNYHIGALDYKIASTTDSLMDPGSSSFRSQNSGFWDSGTDKDMMDSSSSRDSNGSSQDSYFHTNHTHSKSPPFLSASHHHPNSKLMKFNIPWKLAHFKRGSCRKQGVPQDSSIKVGFSEDLGKYKAACVAPSLSEVKEALLPQKLEREANAHGSKREKQGKNERRLYSSAPSNDGCSANVMVLLKSSNYVCNAGAKNILVQDGSTKSFRVTTKGADAGTSMVEEMKAQRSGAVKERWQMYARRLKPLYDMKRGLMEQFRMDECGKGAYCGVEHGTIHSTRLANGETQRRLSHIQPSADSGNVSKSQKLALTQQQKQASGYSNKVLAMSSSPSSNISTPSHSGVLAVLDPNQKVSAPKPATNGEASSKSLNYHRPCRSSSTSVDGASISTSSSKSSGHSALPQGGNSYRSISSMQELHSALQSAIAHCKESNKKLTEAAN